MSPHPSGFTSLDGRVDQHKFSTVCEAGHVCRVPEPVQPHNLFRELFYFAVGLSEGYSNSGVYCRNAHVPWSNKRFLDFQGRHDPVGQILSEF